MLKMQQLEEWKVSDLIEYARNPRKNDHAVDKVAAAIREFGFRVPILAKSDKTVVDGHLRLKAAKKLGLETVPVMLCDDMTDAQIKAFRISVNRVAEFAEWDDELLRVEFAELEELGFNLELTGFDADELSAVMGLDEELDGKAPSIDGGDVLAQRHVFIRPGDTAEELWRRDLAPLGVELLAQTVAAYAEGGYVHGAAQDEALATWEPSIDRPPAYRPDLVMLGLSRPHPWYEAGCV